MLLNRDALLKEDFGSSSPPKDYSHSLEGRERRISLILWLLDVLCLLWYISQTRCLRRFGLLDSVNESLKYKAPTAVPSARTVIGQLAIFARHNQ